MNVEPIPFRTASKLEPVNKTALKASNNNNEDISIRQSLGNVTFSNLYQKLSLRPSADNVNKLYQRKGSIRLKGKVNLGLGESEVRHSSESENEDFGSNNSLSDPDNTGKFVSFENNNSISVHSDAIDDDDTFFDKMV